MNIGQVSKAIVALLTAGGGALIVGLNAHHALTQADWIGAVIVGVTSAAAVFSVVNAPVAGKADVTIDHGAIPGQPVLDEPTSDGTVDPSLLVDPSAAPAGPVGPAASYIPPAVA